MNTIQHFFSGYTAEQLMVMLVGAIIAFTQGLFPGVSILEALKRWLGIDGTFMQWIVIGFFMILSAVAMVATGQLDPASVDWTLKTLLELFAIFYGISQLAYQMLKNRQAK